MTNNEKETITVEEMTPIEGEPKKWFKVTRNIVELMDEEEIKKVYKSIDDAVLSLEVRLKDIPIQAENQTKQAEKDLKVLNMRRSAFHKHMPQPKEGENNEQQPTI